MQGQVIKRIDQVFMEKIVFWSPSANWELKDGSVHIEVFSYSEFVPNLFPTFYFITQQGLRVSSLLERFREIDEEQLVAFVKDLLRNKILVDKLLTPQELYYPQSKLVHNPYDEETFIHPEKYNTFKETSLARSFPNVTDYSVSLADSVFPDEIARRKSYRTFDEKNKISFEDFSGLISVFQQIREGKNIRYHYATAGGLYPIDIFIYIKDYRVENVKAGLYYYNPIANVLQLVSNACVITEEAHYSANKQIFKSSAFSVFMIYDASVTMPKYGGMGYYFASIDTGIMVQLMTQVAELYHFGVCSIGDMNFPKIEKYFKLTPAHVLIHSVEVGLKP